MDADPGAVYLLETAKDRLAKDFPGYRISDVDSFLAGVLAALRAGEAPPSAVVRAFTFPLTKWRTGYAPRDVDRLIGELAQLVRKPGPGADVPLGVREMVDRIRSSRFGTTRRSGYDEEEVDKYLDRIMDGLTRGERGTLRQLAGEPGSRRRGCARDIEWRTWTACSHRSSRRSPTLSETSRPMTGRTCVAQLARLGFVAGR